MARKNRDAKRSPQHWRGAKRPRGWHRKSSSPGTKRAGEFLDRWRTDADGEQAA